MRASKAGPEQQRAAHEACDLRREIAHNLSQVYINSNAKSLARDVLRKHATV